MKFLSNVLAVITGLVVFAILSFFLIAGLVAIATSGDQVKLEENSVLVLNLEGRSIVERTADDDLDLSGFPGFGGPASVGLVQLKKAIQGAKENENIKGIYLKAGMILAGQASIKEIRDELLAFKESGKFIVSYSEYYSEGGYYLSSAADEIYLNPQGMLEMNGLAAEGIFLKGFFEKIGVKPQVFRVGDFKSAVEPFILDKMSDESRLQTQSYLDEMNRVIIESIAQTRGIDLDQVAEISNKMLIKTPKDALTYKFIDGLWYDDQVMGQLRDKLGLEEDAKINTINITNLNQVTPSKNRLSRNRIAVLIAEGNIVGGSDEMSISSDLFLRDIRKLKKDKDIKAVILRINSPGGSALASEVMWRELSELSKEKPLIASMSDVAASGGYYIAAAADTIFAQPNTLTGSIGIFGLWFNAKELLNEKLGITTDVVKTGEFSDFPSAFRQMRSDEEAIYQTIVEEGYDTFLSRVAEGRNMSREEVMQVASGRVWSGHQALDNGLVDILGGLEDAITLASQLIEAEDDFRVIFYPEQKTLIERLMGELSRDVQTAYWQFKTGLPAELVAKWQQIKQLEGPVARMPFFGEIR